MPIKHCEKDGKPGFSWGNASKCWTYNPNDEASKKEAKKKCIKQGIAIDGPKKFKEEVSKSDIEVSAKEIMEVELADFFKKENVDNSEN